MKYWGVHIAQKYFCFYVEQTTNGKTEINSTKKRKKKTTTKQTKQHELNPPYNMKKKIKYIHNILSLDLKRFSAFFRVSLLY